MLLIRDISINIIIINIIINIIIMPVTYMSILSIWHWKQD